MWASLGGLVAIALLVAGGLGALQTGAILTSIPVSIVMIGMCIATYKALNHEHQILVRAERRVRKEELSRQIGKTVTGHLEDNFDDHFGDQVDDRISAALSDPTLSDDPKKRWRRGRKTSPQA